MARGVPMAGGVPIAGGGPHCKQKGTEPSPPPCHPLWVTSACPMGRRGTRGSGWRQGAVYGPTWGGGVLVWVLSRVSGQELGSSGFRRVSVCPGAQLSGCPCISAPVRPSVRVSSHGCTCTCRRPCSPTSCSPTRLCVPAPTRPPTAWSAPGPRLWLMCGLPVPGEDVARWGQGQIPQEVSQEVVAAMLAVSPRLWPAQGPETAISHPRRSVPEGRGGTVTGAVLQEWLQQKKPKQLKKKKKRRRK